MAATQGVGPRDSLLDRIGPGMPREECDAPLRSAALAVAYSWEDGVGNHARVYHLPHVPQILPATVR